MKIYFCIVTSLKSHHEINTRKRTSSFHLDFWLPKSRIPPNEGLKVMWLKFLLSTYSTPVKNLRSEFPIQCKIGIIERITCKWTFTHKFWPNLRARIEIHQTDNIVKFFFGWPWRSFGVRPFCHCLAFSIQHHLSFHQFDFLNGKIAKNTKFLAGSAKFSKA